VEVVVLLVVALVVLAAGIRVGMLLAPRVERMADRAGRVGPESETALEVTPETGTETETETDGAMTHEGEDGHTD
jgi:hypothetical protein